ncbi:CLUMA_CG015997, isoform A [Clunio marinus]|uniref:CLUMA_CG015997, isoform A n=1 Tax=Clunio marinus TaxID=568069 RepID=A0A1J1ITP9_9DIPT|nr:CLUMA_CG015997, isoform A [Clunio marinus]
MFSATCGYQTAKICLKTCVCVNITSHQQQLLLNIDETLEKQNEASSLEQNITKKKDGEKK